MFQLQSRVVTMGGWVLLIAILMFCAWLIVSKPNVPVILHESSLTTAQKNILYDVIDDMGQVSFYHVDLYEVATKIENLSWVDAVAVVRDYKQGIVISVVPKTAVANFGTEQLLDVSGQPFVPADKEELNNKNFVRVYGERERAKDMMQKIYDTNQWFSSLGLYVDDMILTPRHTWLVRFNNGLRVTVDYDRVDDKLFELSKLLKENSLPMPLNEIAIIDLRYKNGFSITKKYTPSKTAETPKG